MTFYLGIEKFDWRSEVVVDNATMYPMKTKFPQEGPRWKTIIRVRNLEEEY